MIGVALKGLGGRKLRSALTMFAIILGVAMVSGTYVLTDTIDKAFSGIFQESYANTDVVVSGKTADISFEGETTEPPPIPEATLDKVRAIPDVEAATGSVVDQTNTKLLTKKGKAVDTGGAPSFGFGIDPAEQRFNPLKLVEGTWAQGPGEVVLDSASSRSRRHSGCSSAKVSSTPSQSRRRTVSRPYSSRASCGMHSARASPSEQATNRRPRTSSPSSSPSSSATSCCPSQVSRSSSGLS
jgi:putative ABC transport system permease protein